MIVGSEPAMSVGIEEIDVRHRQVARRVRHLARAVAEGGVDPVRAALRSLEIVLLEHHALEEAWMAEQGYPGAGEHTRAHRAIVERIAQARAYDAPRPEAGLAEAAESIAEAVDEHMRSDDLKLGRFWTARENLRLLAEAGPGAGLSLTPIPGTLRAVTPAPGRAPANPVPSAPPPAGPRRSGGEDQPAAPPSPRTRK